MGDRYFNTGITPDLKAITFSIQQEFGAVNHYSLTLEEAQNLAGALMVLSGEALTAQLQHGFVDEAAHEKLVENTRVKNFYVDKQRRYGERFIRVQFHNGQVADIFFQGEDKLPDGRFILKAFIEDLNDPDGSPQTAAEIIPLFPKKP